MGILTVKVASMRKELWNIDDLKQLLTCQWTENSLQTLHQTCGSGGKRLQSVQAAQGGHIDISFTFLPCFVFSGLILYVWFIQIYFYSHYPLFLRSICTYIQNQIFRIYHS